MGEIWAHDKLLLFLAFFVPGFISIQIYSMFVPTAPRDFTKSLPEAVAYSAIYYALFGWVLFLVHGIWFIVGTYVIVLIAPILGPIVWLLLKDWDTYHSKVLPWKRSIDYLSPEAEPWDSFFSKNMDLKWIRIRLKDDSIVGGIFGEQSIASTYPYPHELYISEQWDFDAKGTPIERLKGTRGLIVAGDEIKLVEFFEEMQ